MNDAPRPTVLLLAAGLSIGVLADVSLRAVPWGMNAALVIVALTGALLWLQARHGTPAGSHGGFLAATVLALAAGFLWRDATVLKWLDSLAVLLLLGLLASERAGHRVGYTLSGHLVRILGTAVHAGIGPLLLATEDVRWADMRLRPAFGAVQSLVRGLVLAAPLVLGFALLLASADPIFSARLTAWLDVDVFALLGHAIGAFVLGWIATGFLRAGVVRTHPAAGDLPSRPAMLGLGLVEVGIVLGLLDLLFAGFVWVQVRYLFGGASWVREMPGLTYAEYARRGFFEFVTVAALVLPLLLLAHWLLDPREGRERLVFAALAGAQVALVLVMLASAFQRMRLYQAEYGLTELRFYASAFMLWLAALLGWFAVTVLRGRRERFARGGLAAALLALGLLHAVDPEAWIVTSNLGAPRGFDASYALGLSADAVPPVLRAFADLDEGRRRAIAGELLRQWPETEDDDLRSWSLSRARAARLVAEQRTHLRALAAPVATAAAR